MSGMEPSFSDSEANIKGVATLMQKEFSETFELIEIKIDIDGRFQLLNCKIFDIEFISINIYSTTKDNPSGQNITCMSTFRILYIGYSMSFGVF